MNRKRLVSLAAAVAVGTWSYGATGVQAAGFQGVGRSASPNSFRCVIQRGNIITTGAGGEEVIAPIEGVASFTGSDWKDLTTGKIEAEATLSDLPSVPGTDAVEQCNYSVTLSNSGVADYLGDKAIYTVGLTLDSSSGPDCSAPKNSVTLTTSPMDIIGDHFVLFTDGDASANIHFECSQIALLP
jgi:hypothetical protein